MLQTTSKQLVVCNTPFDVHLSMTPAAGYCEPLQTLNDLIAKLDVLVRCVQ